MGITFFPIGASGYPISALSQIASNLVIKQANVQTPSGAANCSFTGLTGKKYMVVWSFTRGTAAASINLTINGLATNTYNYNYLQVVGAVVSGNGLTTQPSVQTTTTPGGTNPMSGVTFIEVNSATKLSFQNQAGGDQDNETRYTFGMNTTAAQSTITTITFTPSAGTLTGKAVLFELEA